MKKTIKKPINKGRAKTPVVMQLEALECGAASLAMVLAYYDKWIPLEQVRSDCGVSRDGSNAKNVLLAARSYGLIAKGFRLEPEMLKKEGQFPCIVHWEFNHFVVVNGFKHGKVYLNDPARGTVVIDEEQFDQSFTGIALFFEPSESFEASGSKKSMLEFARNRLKGAGVAIAFVTFTTVLAALISILIPGFSRFFLDRLLTGKNTELLVPFLLVFLAVALIQIVVEWINAIYALRINGKLAVVGNTSYMWKVLRMPMEFFSQRMAGDIQQRQETNASIAETLVNTFAPLALNIGMLIFYLVVMFRYSVVLSFIGLFSIALNFIVAQVISAQRVNVTRVVMRDEGKLYGTTVAGIEMIETIKASGAENGYFQKWSGYQASVNTGLVKFIKINQLLGIIPTIVTSVTDAVIVILGVYFAVNGSFTVGMVMAFQGLLASFTAPATEFITANQTLQEMRTQMERVEDVMQYPTDVNYDDDDKDKDISYAKLTGNVELRNISFGYSKLAEPLIKDFNLTLKPGSRVAFVGSSGCGKSTLSKLISGLYKQWSGEILFDGKEMSEIDRSVFTGSIAVVDQDITLFEDTISENIKMWDQSIEDFEVIMAARDAALHDDILQRPGGYRGKVSEGGKDFSGGQRQRIEIARVLAQDPTIVILDEATSALDAKTEYDVVKAIKDRGITCIVVAHRLSTIRDCDEIIVLDNGKVVERGKHEELIKLDGYYTKLVTNE